MIRRFFVVYRIFGRSLVMTQFRVEMIGLRKIDEFTESDRFSLIWFCIVFLEGAFCFVVYFYRETVVFFNILILYL